MSEVLFLNCVTKSDVNGHQEHALLARKISSLEEYGFTLGETLSYSEDFRNITSSDIDEASLIDNQYTMLTTSLIFSALLEDGELFESCFSLQTYGSNFKKNTDRSTYSNARLLLPHVRNFNARFDKNGHKCEFILSILNKFCNSAGLRRAHLYGDFGACIPINAHYIYYAVADEFKFDIALLRRAWVSGVGLDCDPLSGVSKRIFRGEVVHEFSIERSLEGQQTVYTGLKKSLENAGLIDLQLTLTRVDSLLGKGGQIVLTEYPYFMSKFAHPIFILNDEDLLRGQMKQQYPPKK